MVLLVTSVMVVLTATGAQGSLPIVEVESADWNTLRIQLRRLVEKSTVAPCLSHETRQALRDLLDRETTDGAQLAMAVQKLLDPACLMIVTINPESRVKVARGPAEARLVKGRDTFVLVKVHNDAGVTASLGVSGPQIRSKSAAGKGRWLLAAVVSEPPFAPRLLGQKLEYVVLRLRAREAGKREATLTFDVGQGSQDLGFRAEVPILFNVREGE